MRLKYASIFALAASISLSALAASISLAPVLASDDSLSLQLPSSLIDLGTSGSSFALVVNKSQSRLDVYRKLEDDSIVRVRSFRASTGLNGGDKQREGDERTPEGIYYFVRIREDNELLSKYGLRAFDLNYPNDIDRLKGKDGHGIWLHATDEPERLNEPRTTLGCVVVSNEGIRELSNYITLYRTPIIISENFSFSTPKEIRASRSRVMGLIQRWLDAWSTQDYDSYISFYSSVFRGGGARKTAWLQRKRNVLRLTRWATIEVADLKMLRYADEYVVSFFQRYRSNLMDDTGIKWVYLIDGEQGLKIVGEEWYPVSKALPGSRWNTKRVRLETVVDNLQEVSFKAGKLVIPRPQYRAPASGGVVLAAEMEQREINPTAEIGVGEFQIKSNSSAGIDFSLKLSNLVGGGKRLRGWLFVVARWEDPESFTSFPSGVVGSGRPQIPSRGDSFGIRWFKIVQGSVERPSEDARLVEVRCMAYSRDGRLLLDTTIPVQLP